MGNTYVGQSLHCIILLEKYFTPGVLERILSIYSTTPGISRSNTIGSMSNRKLLLSICEIINESPNKALRSIWDYRFQFHFNVLL